MTENTITQTIPINDPLDAIPMFKDEVPEGTSEPYATFEESDEVSGYRCRIVIHAGSHVAFEIARRAANRVMLARAAKGDLGFNLRLAVDGDAYELELTSN